MKVSTVILAGGEGSRIGGDKGLHILRGKPLLQWVLDAVRDQSDEVLVSANGVGYAGFGCPVIPDGIPGAGPLGGLHAAMRGARNDWVACVPCDTPYLPRDLLARLCSGIGDADAAVAAAEGRRQPAIALYHKRVLPRLEAWLNGGERRVGSWLDTLHVNEVPFGDARAFVNINTMEDLKAFNHD